jgi:hypothetical protein
MKKCICVKTLPSSYKFEKGKLYDYEITTHIKIFINSKAHNFYMTKLFDKYFIDIVKYRKRKLKKINENL